MSTIKKVVLASGVLFPLFSLAKIPAIGPYGTFIDPSVILTSKTIAQKITSIKIDGKSIPVKYHPLDNLTHGKDQLGLLFLKEPAKNLGSIKRFRGVQNGTVETDFASFILNKELLTVQGKASFAYELSQDQYTLNFDADRSETKFYSSSIEELAQHIKASPLLGTGLFIRTSSTSSDTEDFSLIGVEIKTTQDASQIIPLNKEINELIDHLIIQHSLGLLPLASEPKSEVSSESSKELPSSSSARLPAVRRGKGPGKRAPTSITQAQVIEEKKKEEEERKKREEENRLAKKKQSESAIDFEAEKEKESETFPESLDTNNFINNENVAQELPALWSPSELIHLGNNTAISYIHYGQNDTITYDDITKGPSVAVVSKLSNVIPAFAENQGGSSQKSSSNKFRFDVDFIRSYNPIKVKSAEFYKFKYSHELENKTLYIAGQIEISQGEGQAKIEQRGYFKIELNFLPKLEETFTIISFSDLTDSKIQSLLPNPRGVYIIDSTDGDKKKLVGLLLSKRISDRQSEYRIYWLTNKVQEQIEAWMNLPIPSAPAPESTASSSSTSSSSSSTSENLTESTAAREREAQEHQLKEAEEKRVRLERQKVATDRELDKKGLSFAKRDTVSYQKSTAQVVLLRPNAVLKENPQGFKIGATSYQNENSTDIGVKYWKEDERVKAKMLFLNRLKQNIQQPKGKTENHTINFHSFDTPKDLEDKPLYFYGKQNIASGTYDFTLNNLPALTQCTQNVRIDKGILPAGPVAIFTGENELVGVMVQNKEKMLLFWFTNVIQAEILRDLGEITPEKADELINASNQRVMTRGTISLSEDLNNSIIFSPSEELSTSIIFSSVKEEEERIEKERIERERIQREAEETRKKEEEAERKRLDEERIKRENEERERQRAQQEKIAAKEAERKERERKVEQERLEQERIQREKEEQRLELEREQSRLAAEQAKIAKEKAELARKEADRLREVAEAAAKKAAEEKAKIEKQDISNALDTSFSWGAQTSEEGSGVLGDPNCLIAYNSPVKTGDQLLFSNNHDAVVKAVAKVGNKKVSCIFTEDPTIGVASKARTRVAEIGELAGKTIQIAFAENPNELFSIKFDIDLTIPGADHFIEINNPKIKFKVGQGVFLKVNNDLSQLIGFVSEITPKGIDVHWLTKEENDLIDKASLQFALGVEAENASEPISSEAEEVPETPVVIQATKPTTQSKPSTSKLVSEDTVTTVIDPYAALTNISSLSKGDSLKLSNGSSVEVASVVQLNNAGVKLALLKHSTQPLDIVDKTKLAGLESNTHDAINKAILSYALGLPTLEERIQRENEERERQRVEQEKIAAKEAARQKEELEKKQREEELKRKQEEETREKQEAERKRIEEERIAAEEKAAREKKQREDELEQQRVEEEARLKKEQEQTRQREEAERKKLEEERIKQEQADRERQRVEQERIAAEEKAAREKEEIRKKQEEDRLKKEQEERVQREQEELERKKREEELKRKQEEQEKLERIQRENEEEREKIKLLEGKMALMLKQKEERERKIQEALQKEQEELKKQLAEEEAKQKLKQKEEADQAALKENERLKAEKQKTDQQLKEELEKLKKAQQELKKQEEEKERLRKEVEEQLRKKEQLEEEQRKRAEELIRDNERLEKELKQKATQTNPNTESSSSSSSTSSTNSQGSSSSSDSPSSPPSSPSPKSLVNSPLSGRKSTKIVNVSLKKFAKNQIMKNQLRDLSALAVKDNLVISNNSKKTDFKIDNVDYKDLSILSLSDDESSLFVHAYDKKIDLTKFKGSSAVLVPISKPSDLNGKSLFIFGTEGWFSIDDVYFEFKLTITEDEPTVKVNLTDNNNKAVHYPAGIYFKDNNNYSLAGVLSNSSTGTKTITWLTKELLNYIDEQTESNPKSYQKKELEKGE